MKNVFMVLPALKISGGTLEALNLSNHFSSMGCSVNILAMWKTRNPIELDGNNKINLNFLSSFYTNVMLSLFQVPLICFNFVVFYLKRSKNSDIWVFTHYSTAILLFFVPKHKRVFYVQDLEWEFIHSSFLSSLLKRFLLCCYKTSTIITTNSYLRRSLNGLGIKNVIEYPIWASAFFLTNTSPYKEYDVVMVLRKGKHKRLDLYFEAIKFFRLNAPKISIAVVTTEESIMHSAQFFDVDVYLCVNHSKMREIYRTTKIFLHLSDHEGFGLPPLEAMGSGCVPVCRNSGGPSSYLSKYNGILLLDTSLSINQICSRVMELLDNSQELKILSNQMSALFSEGQYALTVRANALTTLFKQI